MRFRVLFLLILFVPCFFSTLIEGGATLDSPFVQEFGAPTVDSGPFAISVDSTGNVWFTEDNASKIAVFFSANMSFKEFEIPHRGKNLYGLAEDQTGNVWFTGWDTNSVTMLDPVTGIFTEHEVPTNNSAPTRILIDEEGSIWFTEFHGNKIGKLTPTNSEITEYLLHTSDSGPFGITLDRDSNIWFTEAYAGKIAKLDRTSLEITEYVPPFELFSPVGIAVDDQGTVWFAEHGGNDIGKFNPTTVSWSKYPMSLPPPEIYPVSIPNGLIVGHDGSVWFAEHGGNKIGRFDPGEETFTEYWIPSLFATTLWLDQDRNGDIWFTEWNQSKIGVVNASMPLPFSIAIDKRQITLKPGESTTIAVTLTSTQDFSASVTLGLSPDITRFPYIPGVNASLASKQLNRSNDKTELILQASPSIESGVFNITLSGNDGNIWVGPVITLNLVSGVSPSNALPFAIGLVIIGVVVAIAALRYRMKK